MRSRDLQDFAWARLAAYSQRVLVLRVLVDAVSQLGDLVIERPPLGRVLPDVAVGVHDRGVVAGRVGADGTLIG